LQPHTSVVMGPCFRRDDAAYGALAPRIFKTRISNRVIRSHGFAISPQVSREVWLKASRLLKFRGRRECRARDAPAASRVKKQTHERSHHGHTGNHPAFPAQWFYGLLRALPGDQACLTPSPALPIADLTPALGRQNDTTWPYAPASFVRLAVARLTPPRPPHPVPRFVTCATPLLPERDGANQ
jgi:hypothetical protein